jgi:UDP:flavonoid glycosyltransferase YjiC (YdhE family)
VRVLLTAAPSIGHIAPMLGVGTALRDAGHEVRLATHPSGHDIAHHAGLDVTAAGMSEADMLGERRRRWPDTEHQPPSAWGVRMFAQILAPATLRDVRVIVEDWRPELLIHEEGEYAGPVAAAIAGIPCVTHGWGSPLRSVGELTALEADAAPLWDAAGLDMPAAGGLYRDGLLNLCPAFLQADPPGAAVSWRIRPTGLPSGFGEAAPADDVGGLSPLAYVGFGTVAHFADAPDEIRAAVDAVLNCGLAAVVTTTDEVLRRELLDTQPNRVAVRAFLSFPDLFPRCRLVVSHGGAGTVLAALAAGTPQVLVPRGAPSQLRMAAACARAGVGRLATVADIDEVVPAVLDATAIARRCIDAATDITAMAQPSDVVPALERLVR